MTMLTTPLHGWHVAAGAKMAPFAGWDMPIQYSGILQEHEQTRKRAALFDICHMGELLLKGRGAGDALAGALSIDPRTLKTGRCRYGFLLHARGGVLDDLIVYRLGEEEFMLVVNASRKDSDLAVLRERTPGLTWQDISTATGKLDLQGPMSMAALEAVLSGPWRELPYFGFAEGVFQGDRILVSRTGYTGEFGFELYLPSEKTEALWVALLENDQVKPAGLGARDTLRLEIGLPLYGQDLDEEHTPAEAGYAAMLKSETNYVGKGNDREVREKLLALQIPGRRSARHGQAVLLQDGTQAGIITSASFAPSLGHCIALAYVKKAQADATEYLIQADRAQLQAMPVSLPFYTGGTARKSLS